MKRLLCVFLILAVLSGAFVCRASDTVSGTETTEELTETEPPAEEDGEGDLTRTFLNVNIYMFSGAVVLFLICTVVYFVLKKKKKGEDIDER